MDTKKLWDVKDPTMMGRIEPIEITLLLTSADYGQNYIGKNTNICTLDYYVIPFGFEKRMTLYGRLRAGICAGGYDGCAGPSEVYNNFGPERLCKNCGKIQIQMEKNHDR